MILGNSAYFAANNSGGFNKLFRMTTDAASITPVSNIRAHLSQSDGVTNLISWNNNIYFIAGAPTSENSKKIWRYDGANVILVANVRASLTTTDAPAFMTVFGDKLYFVASANADGDRKLFSINTSNTVTQVSNIVGNNTDDPAFLSTWDVDEDTIADYLVFSARKSNVGARKLFIMDSNESIEQVSDILPGGDDNPGPGVSFMGDYYFPAHANSNSDVKLMRLRRH